MIITNTITISIIFLSYPSFSYQKFCLNLFLGFSLTIFSQKAFFHFDDIYIIIVDLWIYLSIIN